MSAPEAIEAIVLRTSASETKASGLTRTVTFLVPNEGEHPFQGMVGTRLHLVCVRINDNESSGSPVEGGEAKVPALMASPSQDRQPGPGEYGGKPRVALADLPASQQAGMRCAEPAFRRFILSRPHARHTTDPAEAVRTICGVASRSDLNTDARAREIWHALDRAYLQETGRLARG